MNLFNFCTRLLNWSTLILQVGEMCFIMSKSNYSHSWNGKCLFVIVKFAGGNVSLEFLLLNQVFC